MNVARRPVLAGLALAMLGGRALAQETGEMGQEMPVPTFGMIGKIKAQPGKRTELIGILTSGTESMLGCLAYLIAEDAKDPDSIWITEIWDNKETHAAALQLPAVGEAIAKGRPLIAAFEISAETRPVVRLNPPA
jgi:quinol monooxygenase YgiN